MIPQLPYDVLVHVCRSVGTSRLDDIGPRTLVSCLRVNHLFNEACKDPAVWKPHYKCRYTHSEPSLEAQRMKSFGNDWRALYAERRRIDQMGIALLHDVVTDRGHRYDHATKLSKLALDVLDALDIAGHIPIPPAFRLGAQEPHGSVRAHALTSRHWANLMVNTIIRCTGPETWNAVKQEELASLEVDNANGVAFERVMSAFSCFFGVSMSDTTSQLDRLAYECREFLIEEGSSLDPLEPTYNVRRISIGICQFMYEQGFGIAEPRQYRKMLNYFPHSYLTTHRKTLPISLVHVFVAICNRIGVTASPINFPGTVLVYVDAQKSDCQALIINPSMMNSARCIMSVADLHNMTSNLLLPIGSVTEHLRPCKATSMLKRHSHNILFAFQEDGELNFTQWLPALLAAVSAQFLLEVELNLLGMLMNNLTELTALDCSAFILNKFESMVSPAHFDLLEQLCAPVLAEEAEKSSVQRIREENASVRYFVGMVFQHARYGYLGCIVGWDFTCRASEEWMRHMNIMKVDELLRGRNQPFYLILCEDATSRYVAEENIVAINPTTELVQKLYGAHPELPIYFEDVELNEVGGTWSRGRFILSPDSQRGYPQDDEIGARWVKEGELPY